MDFYHNPNRPDHVQNVAQFQALCEEFAFLDFFKPSPDIAPWHVQVQIEGGGYPQILNFWPHKMKAYWEGHETVTGVDAIRDLIATAARESQRAGLDDLIED